VFTRENPLSSGHVVIIPKDHYDDINQVPKELLSHFMTVASKAATVLFEGLKAQGTNIIINNGNDANAKFSHFTINVIPRKENDCVALKWELKQGNPEKLKKTAEKIKDETFLIGKTEPKKQEVLDLDKPDEEKKEEKKILSEDYRIKQLKRIP